MTKQAPSPQQLNTEPGASFYSPTILKLYDFGVLGLSNRFAWQCPTKTVLLPFYKKHLGLKHLDVGVGTGFYIARANLTRSHQVSLLDLNENSLRAAAAQVKQAKVRTFMRDVMQPSSEPADTGYDSVSLFYLLHCLPGTMDDKETAIANLKRYMSKDGVLYGATILGDEGAHNPIGNAS
jgi:ubiquinone/menaquinone biosynthesis C-methylase UbiE